MGTVDLRELAGSERRSSIRALDGVHGEEMKVEGGYRWPVQSGIKVKGVFYVRFSTVIASTRSHNESSDDACDAWGRRVRCNRRGREPCIGISFEILIGNASNANLYFLMELEYPSFGPSMSALLESLPSLWAKVTNLHSLPRSIVSLA